MRSSFVTITSDKFLLLCHRLNKTISIKNVLSQYKNPNSHKGMMFCPSPAEAFSTA